MTVMWIYSQVDEDGKITIPNNICEAIGLKEGQLVEFKIVVGIGSGKSILVS